MDWEAALQLKGLQLDRISVEDNYIEVQARRAEKAVPCPYCGQQSSSIHSRYYRHLRDLPTSQFSVRLVVQIRRFRCRNRECCPSNLCRTPGRCRPGLCTADWSGNYGFAATWLAGGRNGRQPHSEIAPDEDQPRHVITDNPPNRVTANADATHLRRG